MNRECGISTVDEARLFSLDAAVRLTSGQKDIPERWRASALSKIEKPPENEVCICSYSLPHP